MLKSLLWLMLDILFVRMTATLWEETDGEINGYIILCALCVVWFTWELIRSIKEWLK